MSYLEVWIVFCNDEFRFGFVLAVNHIHVQPSLLHTQKQEKHFMRTYNLYDLMTFTLLEHQTWCQSHTYMFTEQLRQFFLIFKTFFQFTNKKTSDSNINIELDTFQSFSNKRSLCETLTLCASRRFGECFQRRSYLFLSYDQEFLSPLFSS